MLGSILQIAGLALLVSAGILVSVPATLGAAGVVALYLGLAADRGGR
jgi:hypothetical protein